MKRYRILPDIVVTLLTNYQGWLVGSAAAYLAEDTDKEPNDFDVIIHPDKWAQAMRNIKDTCSAVRFNSFGGLKIDETIDVWPSTLEDMVANGRNFVAYRPVPKAIVRAVMSHD